RARRFAASCPTKSASRRGAHLAGRRTTTMPSLPRETFGVYIRFRNRRLTAARGLSWDEARGFASRLRAERFHEPERVFVLDEQTGATVDDATASESVPVPSAEPVLIDVTANGQAALDQALREARDAAAKLERAIRHAEALVARMAANGGTRTPSV